MFKRMMIPMIAAMVAVTLAFGMNNLNSPKKENLSPQYFRFNGGNPLSSGSYTELTGINAQQQYLALGCDGGQTVCGIIANSSLPATMTDDNEDGLPDVTGVITTVDTKE